VIDLSENMPDEYLAEEIDGKETEKCLADMDDPCPQEDLILPDREKREEVSPEGMPDISCSGYL